MSRRIVPGSGRSAIRRSGDAQRRAGVTGLIVAAACIAGAALFAALSSPASAEAARAQKLVLYSIAEQEQYVDNSDSLTLGAGDNPFGNFKDVAGVTTKNSHGPFPGDEAVFSFNLFTNANLKARAGTAIFTCQYNFSKNAFCDAYFQLKNGGTLIASGAFNFNAARFSLAVTGGYGSFLGKTGVVEETPTVNHAQRLSFQLT